MIVKIALRLHQLHANVDVLVLLEKGVLDEHGLQDNFRVGVGRIRTQLVIKDHDGIGTINVCPFESCLIAMVSLEVDHLLHVGGVVDYVKDAVRGGHVLNHNALLLRAFVVFVEEFVKEILQVRLRNSAHKDQVGHVFSNLFKFSSSPRRLCGEKFHELTGLGRQDEETDE